MKRIVCIICAAVFALTARAEIRLPAFFADGMVLQQQATVRIWGAAAAGAKVTLTAGWDNRTYTCKAASNGSWALKVKTPAAGGPYEVRISDGEEIVLRDVQLGEVWICSGQSNMEMPVKGFLSQPVEGAFEMILDAGKDNVRAFTVARRLSDTPQADCGGKWVAASAGTVPDISSVAYLFACRLHRTLKVPVGIVVAAWGGTSILGWLPSGEIAKTISKEECARILAVHGSDKNHPAKLYNGMIAPIAGYAARGFIWYQGEANVGFADAYGVLQKQLVNTWRRSWGDSNMAFYAVEIAPYRYGRGNENALSRPLLVEAQERALKQLPNTALIPTTDVGDAVCIHPARKRQVGDRLAATALKQAYGLSGLEPESPRIAKVDYADGTAVVSVTSALGAMPGQIRGFEIAGENRRFYAAKAVVDRRKGTILVSSDHVPAPVAVRYAFRNYIVADWTNWMGIPALPCRTDDWPDEN